ncbi:MAG TPA: hypothetical protein PKV27_12750 [Ilumatobacteraceae bacterium]|nr:hypothetical protein [Ilumatobacteraceae bacterium]
MSEEQRDDRDELWRDAFADTPVAGIPAVEFDESAIAIVPGHGDPGPVAADPAWSPAGEIVAAEPAAAEPAAAAPSSVDDRLTVDHELAVHGERVVDESVVTESVVTDQAIEEPAAAEHQVDEPVPARPPLPDRYYPPGYRPPPAPWRMWILPVTIAIIGILIALAILA